MTTFYGWAEYLPCLHCGTLTYARTRLNIDDPVFCHDCTWQRIAAKLGFGPRPAMAAMTEQDVREAESA